MAEIAIQMDDEFLNDLTFFIFSILNKMDVGTSGIHPMFLKNSFFDHLDEKAEAVNRNTLAYFTTEMLNQSQLKNTSLQN